MKSLREFKGEEAFKVMGRVITCLKRIFQDEKAAKIIVEKKQENPNSDFWMMDFLEYTLTENSKEWLDLFCVLNPNEKREDVSTDDVISFAFEFFADDRLRSLFFSQSQQVTSKTSIGSAMASTEV